MYEIQLEPEGKVTLPEEYVKELNLQVGQGMTIELLYKDPETKRGPYLFIYPHIQRVIDM